MSCQRQTPPKSSFFKIKIKITFVQSSKELLFLKNRWNMWKQLNKYLDYVIFHHSEAGQRKLGLGGWGVKWGDSWPFNLLSWFNYFDFSRKSSLWWLVSYIWFVSLWTQDFCTISFYVPFLFLLPPSHTRTPKQTTTTTTSHPPARYEVYTHQWFSSSNIPSGILTVNNPCSFHFHLTSEFFNVSVIDIILGLSH